MNINAFPFIDSQISMIEEGLSRYRLLNPFRLPNGDHLSLILKRTPEGQSNKDYFPYELTGTLVH